MRKKDLGETREMFRLVALQPKNLRRGETGQHVETDEINERARAAEMGADEVALLRRGGIAPELGRSDDPAILVERDETVLLARCSLSRRSTASARRG